MKLLKIKGQQENKSALLLIFLGWLVYATSYLGKVNYSANITQVIDFYGVTKAQAGTAPTFFFFAYGIGQVLNGLFCKKYNIKWMVFIGLFTSASINLTIAVSSNFAIIKWLWMLNGIALSMLWPSLIRLLSETLPKKHLETSSLVMGTTVATGTLMIYALSSVYAAFHIFKLSFYTAAFAGITVSFFWLFVFDKTVKNAKSETEKEEVIPESEKAVSKANKTGGKIFFATIPTLCFFAVGVNLIKDGLTTWVPSILKEEFHMSDSISILLTLFLPLLAVFGNVFALMVHRKIPDYVNHCTLIFSGVAILIGIIIGCLKLELAILMIVCLVAANFFAASLNNLLTVIFPLLMRGSVSSGLIAGILNGFCYLGSTISSYGLGSIADHFGWTFVFWTLIGFCGVVVITWCIYLLCKKFTEKKQNAIS